MSWCLSARGQPKAVKKIIDEQAHARYDPTPADDNTTQKRMVAALVLATIDSLKIPNNEYNGVRVEASGHLHSGFGNLKVELSMDRFSLDSEPPPAMPVVGRPEDPFGQTQTLAPPQTTMVA